VGRVPPVVLNPNDAQALVERVNELLREFNGRVSFGHPQDPNGDTSTTLAGGTGTGAHNGTLANIEGSYVELKVTALDTNVSCLHRLNLQIPSASQPNVRWLVCGWQHNGTGVTDGTATVSASYEDGTVTADDCPLRFYAAGGRTVDGDNPLGVTLFFWPAVRGVAQ
jgi:hypothetical protein